MEYTVGWQYHLLFAVIEGSFFIANVAKIKERWMFLFFELFIFMTMYVWYNARKINNRFLKFVDLGKYIPQLKELSEDDSIPKFSTHVIYLSKANSRSQIEEKIIRSIFPKNQNVQMYIGLYISTEQKSLIP
jgi:KUP system potassium uptake protein